MPLPVGMQQEKDLVLLLISSEILEQRRVLPADPPAPGHEPATRKDTDRCDDEHDIQERRRGSRLRGCRRRGGGLRRDRGLH